MDSEVKGFADSSQWGINSRDKSATTRVRSTLKNKSSNFRRYGVFDFPLSNQSQTPINGT